MAARLLHFGPDDCNRLIVLQSAGYAVDLCSSFQDLQSAFDGSLRPDAVLMTANGDTVHREAISLVRSYPPTPLILFERSGYSIQETEFDLVVPALTSPSEWLRKIADLIQYSRTLIVSSQQVREHSALIRKESELIRREAMLQREHLAATAHSPVPAPKAPRKTG